jgi:hypothetical protein
MTDKTLIDVLRLKSSPEPDEFIGTAEAYGVIGVYGGRFLGQRLTDTFVMGRTPSTKLDACQPHKDREAKHKSMYSRVPA